MRRFILRYLKPFLIWEIILLLLLLGTSLASLASPYILKIIIDDVFPSGDQTYLIKVLGILVIIYLLRIGMSFLSDYLQVWVGNKIILNIRKDLFAHILLMPMAALNENKKGDIIHRISNEVENVRESLTENIIRLLTDGFTIIFIAVMLCILNWKLFLITSVIFPFTFLNVRYFQPRIKRIVQKNQSKESDILTFLSERLDMIKLVKISNTFGFENRRFDTLQKEFLKLDLKRTLLASGTRSIATFLIALSPILVFGWGGQKVLAGMMSLGTLIAFLQYLNRLYGPLRNIMGVYIEIVEASVSLQRIIDFFETPIERRSPTSQKLKSLIQFRDVSFKYDYKWILKDLNFQFEIGKKYALVGCSGSGKSTLVDLICNFYNPETGQILIDDFPLNEICPHAWRKQVALVSQDTLLFNDTVYNNLIYGSDDDGTKVKDIARTTKIHEHISGLEEGYSTKVGDKGVKLSGGQKQRIAMARAFMKKAQIVIFDEATSALDSKVEMEIFQNLNSHLNDKIFIAISHRLSTVKIMDEVICLDQGNVVERGTPDYLKKKQGFYYELFHNQL